MKHASYVEMIYDGGSFEGIRKKADKVIMDEMVEMADNGHKVFVSYRAEMYMDNDYLSEKGYHITGPVHSGKGILMEKISDGNKG